MDHSAVPRLGDLFERHPVQFGLRGALFLWDALRTEFASAPLPSSWLQLRSILIEAIQRRIGRPLHAEADSASVYIHEFDPGHGCPQAGST